MENVENSTILLFNNALSSGKSCELSVEKFFSKKIVYFLHNLMYTNRSLVILWGRWYDECRHFMV